jgi:O-6-methylguanine DNA methyltransferase
MSTRHWRTRAGSEPSVELPLDWRGISAWDRRVLEGARTLQRGEVTSYGRLARRIGAPGAARAVGAALGRNPFWLLIPCHRVVAGDGSIGGYGGAGMLLALATEEPIDLHTRRAELPENVLEAVRGSDRQ